MSSGLMAPWYRGSTVAKLQGYTSLGGGESTSACFHPCLMMNDGDHLALDLYEEYSPLRTEHC